MKYLWLKSVDNVNLDFHCAKCLLGEYDDRINSENIHFNELDLDYSNSGIYYLCGVSYPFVYSNNIHLAFMFSKGSNISISNNLFDIEISDAVIVPFGINDIDVNHKKAKYRSYYTCRNWQFANKFINDFKSD